MIVFKDIYEVEDVESEMDFKLIEEVGEEAFYSLWNEATGEPVAHDQFAYDAKKLVSNGKNIA